MSRFFTSSIAATSLMALLAGSAFAQDSAPAQQAQPGRVEAAAPVELPKALQDIGLTGLTSKKTRQGNRISGKLPDGAGLTIFVDERGELRGLRAEGDGTLPANLIERLVPQPVRSQQIYGQLGRIEGLFLGDEGVMLAGKDAQSKPVRAAFAPDGTLMRFGRGEDHGPGKGPDRGPREGHGKDRGDRGHMDRDRDRGSKDPRHGEKRGGGDRADAPRGPGQPMGPEDIRASLGKAGYTNVGQILQQGPITVAQATNPEGEPVLVEIGPKGRIVRELNR